MASLMSLVLNLVIFRVLCLVPVSIELELELAHVLALGPGFLPGCVGPVCVYNIFVISLFYGCISSSVTGLKDSGEDYFRIKFITLCGIRI